MERIFLENGKGPTGIYFQSGRVRLLRIWRNLQFFLHVRLCYNRYERGVIMNSSKIITLSRKARNGDKKALNELYNINKRLSKQANTQMKELRAKGYTNFGYAATAERNKILTGRTRFKHGADIKKNVELLTENALGANKFLEYDTSTVAGYEELMNKHIEAVEAYTKSKIKDRELFNDFMKTETFAELMKIDSGQTLEMTVDSIQDEKDIKKLERLYRRYEQGKIAYDEMIEEFTGVNPFD